MIHPCTSHWDSSQNRLSWSIRAVVTGVPLRTGCHDPSVQQSLVFLSEQVFYIHVVVTGVPPRTGCHGPSVQQSLVFLSEQDDMIHPCSSHWDSSQNTLSWSIRVAVTGIPLRTGCHAALMIHPCISHCKLHLIPLIKLINDIKGRGPRPMKAASQLECLLFNYLRTFFLLYSLWN